MPNRGVILPLKFARFQSIGGQVVLPSLYKEPLVATCYVGTVISLERNLIGLFKWPPQTRRISREMYGKLKAILTIRFSITDYGLSLKLTQSGLVCLRRPKDLFSFELPTCKSSKKDYQRWLIISQQLIQP